MDIERHLFAIRRPMLVTEAVQIFPIQVGSEGIVALRYRPVVLLVVARGILDLFKQLKLVISDADAGRGRM